ncbi:sestrin-3 isoform X1 [Phycodurus eques]|uniref:sestrin-3 isoform X1 n=1 Tax=Phycodurus eques TaxID=693459 RepID=UPI002ACD5C15|nr:sestrin-3 isoform X1 [Phycodurus eques]
MIICTNTMEYPLRSQCQRVQKQVMVNKEKECVSLVLMKAALSRGNVDAITQQMASHPQYLESFLRAQHYILHMDGPLPLPCRHYIAIMAAARHHCNYLVYLHSAQFLRLGGDPVWLQGLEAAPPRLRLLDHINKVLAHQPWLAACSHIKTLLKCGEQCWSLAELVQAVVILAHCHSLCSFVFGSNADSVHMVPQTKSPNGTPPAFCAFDAANGNPNGPQSFDNTAEQNTRRLSVDSSSDVLCLKERIHRSQEDRDKREERLLHSQTLQQADVYEGDELIYFADPSRFVTDPDFYYQEFARRDEDHFQVFRVQDYSWEDHGFSLVNRLYSDIGHLLDDRFRSVTALSSLHSPDLKRAIWNYIHCILGIRYDDYDYGEVNQLLERNLKLYIKAVACFPDPSKAPTCPLGWAPLKTSERFSTDSNHPNHAGNCLLHSNYSLIFFRIPHFTMTLPIHPSIF